MKNVNEYNLKNCIFKTSDEMLEDIRKAFGVKANFELSVDGIQFTKAVDIDDDFYTEPIETDVLFNILAKYYGVEEITSIHIDDCDEVGIWICYKPYDYRSWEHKTKNSIIDRLIKIGASMIEINLINKETLDFDRKAQVWYNGFLGSISFLYDCNYYCVDIYCSGNVSANLYPEDDSVYDPVCIVRDRAQTGKFKKEMGYYFKNDEEMYAAEASESLCFLDNSWFEMSLLKNNEYVNLSTGLRTYQLFENILDCYEEAVDIAIETIVED